MVSKLDAVAVILFLYSSLTKAHSIDLIDIEDNDLVVQLAKPLGKIQGHTIEGLNGKNYYAFQDVPYAQPPVGENRFKPPKPLDSWDGVIQTTSNKKICPQNGLNTIIGVDPIPDEDCLVLNVYSPVKPGSTSSLPVYFWIHGGDFWRGSGQIADVNPQYFISNDIVVVTVNYRLGILGFLALNDENISGNLGLKDQQLALKWVSENIHLFGGNPQHIVVGGEDAGAISASYQLLAKSNEGLIKAVIQQSGSAVTAYGFQINYRALAFEAGRRMNSSMNTNNNKELTTILMNAPASEVLRVQKEYVSTERIGYIMGQFWKPIVEDESIEGALITQPMREAFENGNFNRVPTLVGFNSEESLTYLSGTSDADYTLAATLFDRSPALLISDKLNIPQSNKATAGKEVKALYTSVPFLQNKTAFVRYCSDASFIRSTLRQAEATSHYVPVYLYQFSYSDNSDTKIPGTGQTGHGVDVPYFWNSPDTPSPFPKPNENIRESLLKLWTNFIKEQNPTPQKDEHLQNIIWPTTDASSLQYLNIDSTFSTGILPRQYKEVKAAYDKYLQRPFNVY